MKVYNLSIDSSQRGVNVIASNSYYDTDGTYVIDEYSNTLSRQNNYVIHLENPIYDVTEIKLVSARIPTPQLTVCATNNTFSVDGVDIALDVTNYSSGTDLANDLQLKFTPPTSNVDSVIYDSDTNGLIFSNNSPGDNNFTFEFHTGTNGFNKESSQVTTPYQLLGFSYDDYTSVSNVLVSGAINLYGPNSLVLKLTAGSDEFGQSVYTSTPFYTGHILLDGSDFINFNGADDTLTHRFHSGSQKYIRDIKIEFFYMSNGRLIPYDFMNQDHILKFEITCSTDKLQNLPKIPIEEVTKEEPISIPEVKNVYRWKREYTYIIMIVVIGIMLLLLMKQQPRRYRRPISE
ncbi:hypothetical protein OAE98_03740 [Akkermansiaceae bacterium]|nr:hypothetical protein [Akkermansiaceae bacterium]